MKHSVADSNHYNDMVIPSFSRWHTTHFLLQKQLGEEKEGGSIPAHKVRKEIKLKILAPRGTGGDRKQHGAKQQCQSEEKGFLTAKEHLFLLFDGIVLQFKVCLRVHLSVFSCIN